MKTLYFYLVSNALDRRDYRRLRDKNLIASVIKRVPEGIYHFEVFSSQHEVISFSFRTKTDVLKDFLDVLYDDLQIPNFRNTLCISILLFGDRPLPPDNYTDIVRTIEVLTDRLKYFWGRTSLIFSPSLSEDLPPPPEVVDNYRALNTLRRVADWQNRAASGPLPTGLDAELDLYLARTIGSPIYDWRTAKND